MVYFGKWSQRGQQGLGKMKQVRKESQYKDVLSRQPPFREQSLGDTVRDFPRSYVDCVSELSALEMKEDYLYTTSHFTWGRATSWNVKSLVLLGLHRCGDGWVVPIGSVRQAKSKRYIPAWVVVGMAGVKRWAKKMQGRAQGYMIRAGERSSSRKLALRVSATIW